jgi:peptidyl-prolyl cis-trans isomerase B (cyclophilin B)
MARWMNARLATAGLLAALGVVGCGKAPAQPDAPANDAKPHAAASDKAAPAAGEESEAPVGDRMNQPFAAAVREGDNPPQKVNRPADTVGGLPSYMVLSEVKKKWDDIRFATPDGRPLRYTAVLDTDQGPIEIELRPDVAPNAVRNFVALAQAHYYDGLHFDHIHCEPPVEYIVGGCPIGAADIEDGSIGYWMRYEASGLKNEPGAVGAYHGYDRDGAACKFYINLSEVPKMDGQFTVFGRVTGGGLDVARRIFKDSRDENGPPEQRPAQPVTIRSVTIRVAEAAPSK